MNTQHISWEIVLAGLAFTAIGIYLVNQSTSSEAKRASVAHTHPAPPSPSGHLPNTLVIDLQNLESLKNLEELKNLKNFEELKELEFELRNLDQVIQQRMQNGNNQKLDSSLKQLESELQKIESADYNVRLQDKKVYINKDYNVDEAQWSEVSPGVYIYQYTFTADNLQSMDFNTGFGNINVVGNGSSSGEITLRATGDMEDPAAFSEHINIEKNITSSEGAFKVTAANNSDISNRINLEATLTLPKNTKVNAQTSGGHINASNLSSNLHFNTSGGHIMLDAIEGETVAKTGGGHITCEQISGNTKLTTGGGHIKVNNSTGSLSVKTGGGHIEVQNASGSVMAKTSGGNISTSIQDANGPLNFHTSAGNISLLLPETISANLDISGSTVSLAELFNFDGTKSQGSISGTINGGGLPIVASCGYGKVNINANK